MTQWVKRARKWARKWARKMTPWVKRLLCKCEDPSLDPHNLDEKAGCSSTSWVFQHILVPGRQKQADL